MLSKCANPSCSAQFRYLHLGKLFHLCPIPEFENINDTCSAGLHERFWLCEECCQKFTVIWDGFQAEVVVVKEEAAKAVAISIEDKQQVEAAREAP